MPALCFDGSNFRAGSAAKRSFVVEQEGRLQIGFAAVVQTETDPAVDSLDGHGLLPSPIEIGVLEVED